MAVYMSPARKTKLMRYKGNWKDKANTEQDFLNKGKQKQRGTRRIHDERRRRRQKSGSPGQEKSEKHIRII